MSSSPSPLQSTSASLIARVRANEALAWDRLVTLYSPLVYHWCRRAGLQSHDREDVFQEVFEAVLGHIRRFEKRRRGDTFRGWLFTITKNKIRDHFRRARRQPRGAGGSEALRRLSRVEAPAEDGAPFAPRALADLLEDPVADAPVERALTRRALDLIREEFRETTWRAFWRTAIDDCPAGDVADELGMRPGAVRVAKSRVLRRLREELGDVEDGVGDARRSPSDASR